MRMIPYHHQVRSVPRRGIINIILLVVATIFWISTVISLVVALALSWYEIQNCYICLNIWETIRIPWIIFGCCLIFSVFIEIVTFFVRECRKEQDQVPLLSDYDNLQMITRNTDFP